MKNRIYLTSLLDYDPDSGLFTWKIAESRRIKVGAIAGTNERGYVRIRIKGKAYPAHRLAWFYVYKVWPTAVDHINCNKQDNRIENLREYSSASDNLSNTKTRKNNKLGIKGVYWHDGKGCYIAKFKYKSKEYSCRFENISDADTWLSEKRTQVIGTFSNNG